MYDSGEIIGISYYDLYEYNTKGQLATITTYVNNIYNGFQILKTKTYSYTSNGKIEKELNSTKEYTLYKYNKGLLAETEKYGNKDDLEFYILNEYDQHNQLTKETMYASDNVEISYTLHIYTNGLLYKSDVYDANNSEHLREIKRTYDNENNLIILESNELAWYSSLGSFVNRYEYND